MRQRAMTRTVSKKVKRFLWGMEWKVDQDYSKKKFLARRAKCVRDQKICLANIFNLAKNLTIKEEKIIGAIFQAVKMVHVFSKDGPTLVGGVVVKKLQRA